jgi:hypothetical protein
MADSPAILPNLPSTSSITTQHSQTLSSTPTHILQQLITYIVTPMEAMGTAELGVVAVTFAATAVREPLTEFTFFSKLPIEIRLKIFKYALPIGPQSCRMLRVAIRQIVSKSITTTTFEGPFKRLSPPTETTGKVSMFLTCQLLEHEHNSFIRDLGLLAACSESRGVYLKRFTGSLRTGEQGLIRFAKEDIVYISKKTYNEW